MGVLEIYGWAVAIIGAGFSAPQLLKVVRAKSVAGLSLVAWQLAVGCSIAWVTHAVLAASANIAINSLLIGLCNAAILFFIKSKRSLGIMRVKLVPLALSSILIAVDVLLGPLAFGLAVMIPQSVSLLAMIYSIVAEHSLRGVSPGYLIFGSLIQSAWLGWAVMARDSAVTFSSGSQLVLLATALSCYVARMFGWQPDRFKIVVVSVANTARMVAVKIDEATEAITAINPGERTMSMLAVHSPEEGEEEPVSKPVKQRQPKFVVHAPEDYSSETTQIPAIH